MKSYMMMAVLLANFGIWGMMDEDSGFESASPPKAGIWSVEDEWQKVSHRKKKQSPRRKKYRTRRGHSPEEKLLEDMTPADEPSINNFPPCERVEESAVVESVPQVSSMIQIIERRHPLMDLRRDPVIPLTVRRYIAGSIMTFLNEYYADPFPAEEQDRITEQADYLQEARKEMDGKIENILQTLLRIETVCPLMSKRAQEWSRAVSASVELKLLEDVVRTKIKTPQLRVQYRGFEDFYGVTDEAV